MIVWEKNLFLLFYKMMNSRLNFTVSVMISHARYCIQLHHPSWFKEDMTACA